MRLTTYTDYALRLLIHLAVNDEKICAISEVSAAYGVSQHHLTKVAHGLVKDGYVASVRGRAGGLRLARHASAINVGDVVRHTEDRLDLVDCGSCVIAPACGLTGVLGQAMAAFMAVLDRTTLADIANKRNGLRALLETGPA